MTPTAQAILDKCRGCPHLVNDPSKKWSITYPLVCNWKLVNEFRSPRNNCLKRHHKVVS